MDIYTPTHLPHFVPLEPVERDTLTKLFWSAVERYADIPALRSKVEGRWTSHSYRDVGRQVSRLAGVLTALGIERGDHVALLSENRPEWAITDYALLGLGAVDVPLSPSLAAEQISFILQDAAAKAIFVSTGDLLAKLEAIRPHLPDLKHIIVFDDPDGAEGVLWWHALLNRTSHTETQEAAVRAQALAVQPNDLATLVYTSGTTGMPKGVMLSHFNLAAMVVATHQHGAMPLAPGEVVLSLLPLSHVFERAADYYYWDSGVTIVYPESIKQMAATFREARPHFLVGVPRLFDRIYSEALRTPGPRGRIVRWAMRVGSAVVHEQMQARAPAAGLMLHYRLADALVFRTLRTRMGGRVRALASGGAPLSPEVATFFLAAGLPIYEGYGLTETAPILTANRPGAVRLGSVGLPHPGVELCIAPHGEILARGPSLMRGYWKAPDATTAAIDRDGWFHTGDVGRFDADGFLSITGRIKDLIIPASGENIAPQPVEQRAETSPYVAHAVLLGDRWPYPIMLVAPDFESLHAWIGAQGIENRDQRALCKDRRVKALLEQEIRTRLQDRAPYERPRTIALLPDNFTIESGMLTPTLKVKRQVVEQRYADVIDAVYASTLQQTT